MALAYIAGALLVLGAGNVSPGMLLGAGLASLLLVCVGLSASWPSTVRLLILTAVLSMAGALGSASRRTDVLHSCMSGRSAGALVLEGRFDGYPGQRAIGFWVERGTCQGDILPALAPDVDVLPGRRVLARGWWRVYPDGGGVFVVRGSEDRPEVGWSGWALRLRGRGLQASQRWFGDAAPLLDALLWARRERIDSALAEAFARGGVAHLLAISGFHVGVVATALYALLLFLPLSLAVRLGATLTAVGLYVAVLGFPGAATRAAFFIALAAGTRIRGRPWLTAGVLASTGLCMVVLRPEWVGSPGLQLSFAGIAGLSVWRRPLQRWIGPLKLPRALGGAVAATLSASLATAPLVAWHFGSVSLVGLPLSVLLTPLAGAVILSGLLTLGLAPVLPPLAGALGDLTSWGASIFAYIVASCARPEWAAVPVSRPIAVIMTACAVLAWHWTRRVRPSWRAATLVTMTLSGPLLAPAVGRWGGRGRLDIYAIDVGQGDALALRSPAGRWMLVDAGGLGGGFDAGRDRVLPFLRAHGVRSLSALVLSHADLDHSGGAASTLAALPVEVVIDPGVPAASAPYLGLLREARANSVPWVPAAAGEVLDFDGVRLEVLAPGPADSGASLNDRSVVLLVRFGDFEALLTGDISQDVERRLIPRLPSSLELLKVAHHGSATSSAWELLEATRPQLAVISVGRRNRYGHPDAKVLARLEAAGARIVRTDQEGTVRVRVHSGTRWTVHTSR